MCFGLSCSQMQFNSNRTSLRTFIFPTPQGFLPLGVTKIRSLVQTGLTARSWQSGLPLRGLSSFTPSGFMLAHVFFSSFVLFSRETSSQRGLFTFVLELAHMALNSFASRQRHYQASIFYCCIDSQCAYGRILPCIFVLVLLEVLKDTFAAQFSTG